MSVWERAIWESLQISFWLCVNMCQKLQHCIDKWIVHGLSISLVKIKEFVCMMCKLPMVSNQIKYGYTNLCSSVLLLSLVLARLLRRPCWVMGTCQRKTWISIVSIHGHSLLRLLRNSLCHRFSHYLIHRLLTSYDLEIGI